MSRVVIAAGVLISIVLVDLFSLPATPSQIMPTRLPQRFSTQPATLGVPEIVVTLTLVEPSVQAVVSQAADAGASRWQRLTLAAWQWLHLTDVQTQLIKTLTAAPYHAVLVKHTVIEQNSLTMRVRADNIRQMQALPGIASVQTGDGSRVLPTEIAPGTRLPPFRPPGVNPPGTK